MSIRQETNEQDSSGWRSSRCRRVALPVADKILAFGAGSFGLYLRK